MKRVMVIASMLGVFHTDRIDGIIVEIFKMMCYY